MYGSNIRIKQHTTQYTSKYLTHPPPRPWWAPSNTPFLPQGNIVSLPVIFRTLSQLVKKVSMLFGDVESNPGPVTLTDIMTRLDAMCSELKEINISQHTIANEFYFI